jgi:hypothetical protein
MEKELLGFKFKYENEILYKLNRLTNKWMNLNEYRPRPNGDIYIVLDKRCYTLDSLIYLYHHTNYDIEKSKKAMRNFTKPRVWKLTYIENGEEKIETFQTKRSALIRKDEIVSIKYEIQC